MSLTKVIKETKKLVEEEKRRSDIGRNIFLFSDSKGKCLKKVAKKYDNLKIIAKASATVWDQDHRYVLIRKVHQTRFPIVLIWLGTCEITEKSGKYINLRDYPYQTIEDTLTEYRELKHSILQANRQTIVIFLECPYYSVIKANKIKGDKSVDKHNSKDKIVCDLVDYFNEKIRLLNPTNITIPRLAQDIITASKPRTRKEVKYRKNFNLFHDRVHPLKPLAEVTMVTQNAATCV